MAEIIVGSMVTIVSQIKEAADTVRRNKKECSEIARCVDRNRALLKLLEEGTEIAKEEVICKVMEDVTESLNKALKLVTECQERHIILRCFGAADMAADLRRVREDIGHKISEASLATNIHGNVLMTKHFQLFQHAVALGRANETQSAHCSIPSRSPAGHRTRWLLLAGAATAAAATAAAGVIAIMRHSSKSAPAPKAAAKAAVSNTPHVTRRASAKLSSEAQSAGGVNVLLGDPSTCDGRNEVNDVEVETMESTGRQSPSSGFRQFSLSQLKVATNDFSSDNMIGRGSFATIYKGVLGDGSVVAIKEIKASDDTLDRQLMRREFNMHAKLNQHKNVAKLVGYCIDVKMSFHLPKERNVDVESRREFLVLQYIPNGNLGMIIQGTTRIDWSACFRIVQGIVEGLHSIHEQRIVHMDLKPENILLDSDMDPVIFDFGISILLDHNADEAILDDILGTAGYIPPEQLINGTASTKSDIYAFGVTLRKTIASVCTGSSEHWQSMLRNAGGVAGSLDPKVLQVDESQLLEIKRCEEVALLCTEYDQRDRPTTGDVLQMLRGEKELPVPNKPYP